MNKKDLLKLYTEDPLLLEKGYLSESKPNNFKSNEDYQIFIELLEKLIRDTDLNNSGDKGFKGTRAVTNTLNRYIDSRL